MVFLPSKNKGFPVKIVPSSNSMIDILDKHGTYGKKKGVCFDILLVFKGKHGIWVC